MVPFSGRFFFQRRGAGFRLSCTIDLETDKCLSSVMLVIISVEKSKIHKKRGRTWCWECGNYDNGDIVSISFNKDVWRLGYAPSCENSCVELCGRIAAFMYFQKALLHSNIFKGYCCHYMISKVISANLQYSHFSWNFSCIVCMICSQLYVLVL